MVSESLSPRSNVPRNALQCGKYSELRLLEHCMKIWGRVLYERLKHVMEVVKNQSAFMAENSTTGTIFIIRQQEKYLEKICKRNLQI